MEEISISKRNRTLANDTKSRMQKSQNEVRDMFKKIRAWREESQKEFSNIIDPYSNRISLAFNDLIEENNYLQGRLSVVTQDRNYLRNTVDDLNAEIRQLRSKSPIVAPLQNIEESRNYKAQELDTLKVENANTMGGDIDIERSDMEEYGDSADPFIKLQNSDSLFDQDFFNDYDFENEDVSSTKDVAPEEQFTGQVDDNAGNEDNFGASKAKETESTLFVNALRNKINYLLCKRCDKKFADKKKLGRHIKEVHLMSKSICKECDKAFANKYSLNAHIKGVHFNKKSICKECDKAFADKYSLNAHKKGVHLKIRDHICDDCGAAFSYKNKLTRHRKQVHLPIK